MPVSIAGLVPAEIEMARVLDVNIQTYTLSVATNFSRKPLTGISFATPYQHHYNGEGIYFMPEVGSLCWVCKPSDGNRPFVIAWSSAQDEGDFRAMKKDLNPGDIYLGTRDENFLILRRGGVVQIGGGPLSQRMFVPLENTIKDFCENYLLSTLGGELEWSIAREESTTDGKRPASLKVKAKEYANDAKPIAELEIGSHEGGGTTILSLLIKASGTQGADTKISLTLGKDGKVIWDVKNEFNVTSVNNINLKSSSGSINFEASNEFFAKASAVKIQGQNSVSIESIGGTVTIKGTPSVNISPMLKVGSGSLPVALATPLIAWLATHTHTCTIPSQQTSPPTQAPMLATSGIISKVAFAE